MIKSYAILKLSASLNGYKDNFAEKAVCVKKDSMKSPIYVIERSMPAPMYRFFDGLYAFYRATFSLVDIS